MESNVTTVNGKPFNKFEIPLKMGLLIAIVKIIFSTVQYQFFIGSFGMNMLVAILSFIVGVVLLYFTGKQQRDAMGGYMDIRQAFSALFVTILVAVVLTYAYDLIYMKFIDPSMVEKMKESSISFAENMGAPQEQLDEMADKFDKEQAESNSIGKQALSLAMQLVWYGIVAFIIAAIVKKNKPIFEA